MTTFSKMSMGWVAISWLLAGLVWAAEPGGEGGVAGREPFQTIVLSAGVMSQRTSGALAVNTVYPFGPGGGFQMGFGIRASVLALGGNAQPYTTADPGLLAAGQVGTLRLDSTQTYSINAAWAFEYVWPSGWSVGMNIDLVGFSLGPPRVGAYTASDDGPGGAVQARAQGVNFLLGGVRDRGQLNSQFYVAYQLFERWGVRGGFSHFISEVRADEAPEPGNQRFRLTNDMVFLALFYRIGGE